jgi:hypothetical protein
MLKCIAVVNSLLWTPAFKLSCAGIIDLEKHAKFALLAAAWTLLIELR